MTKVKDGILGYVISLRILGKLSKHDICVREQNEWIWKEKNKRLFAYFCWYVTELCETNGLRMYKADGSTGKTDIQAFCNIIKNKNPCDVDRNAIMEFKGKRDGNRHKPEGHEQVEKATKEVLASILNFEVKEIDYNKFL